VAAVGRVTLAPAPLQADQQADSKCEAELGDQLVHLRQPAKIGNWSRAQGAMRPDDTEPEVRPVS
jgi:hypothetical protein